MSTAVSMRCVEHERRRVRAVSVQPRDRGAAVNRGGGIVGVALEGRRDLQCDGGVERLRLGNERARRGDPCDDGGGR